MARRRSKDRVILTPEEERRLEFKKSLFFEPCVTREELQEFLRLFLKLDFPDSNVDELSTSTPLDIVWTVYNTMRTNEGPLRHVAACARGTSKTLTAATIEFLAMVHFRRDIAHIASIKQQSKKALKYFKKFCNIDVLKPYFTTESTFEFELSGLPHNSFTKKNDARLVTCAATLEAVNGERSNLIIFDEIDLVNQEVISEASMMQTPTADNHFFEPISVYLSSRKTNDGPVQSLLDEAESGSDSIRLHKFSLVDWMRKCQPETHGDHGVGVWINRENLKMHWDDLPESEPINNYIPRVVYENCRTCPAMIVCQGRSPHQKSTSPYLKSIKSVSMLVDETKRDSSRIIGQLLNWRPDSSGTVFALLSRSNNALTPTDSWKFVTGRIWASEQPPSKQQIYKAAMDLGWECVFGIDFGYKPDPAVVVVVLYHGKTDRCLLLHIRSATEVSNHLWAQSVEAHEGVMFPPVLICPDTADTAAPTYFNLSTKKKPMKIETGVSQIRGLIFDPTQQTSKFAIAMYDSEAEWTYQCFSRWRHKTTVTGQVDSNSFEDSDATHPVDATRYALDYFIKKGQTVLISSQKSEKEEQIKVIRAVTEKAYIKQSQDAAIEEYKQLYKKQLSEEFGINVDFSQMNQVSTATVLSPDDTGSNKNTTSDRPVGFAFKF